ncbi:MAG TPA: SRPBCC family protein, partial [Candidatus Thermoplasmatota archaeon]|nr:SRPBCC family protein [Candidatus Thermoplasmatota archaeon]
PVGEVRVRFVAKNALRVLDHDVTLPSGDIVHNPMRVLRNDAGSEAVFTLYRRDGVGETEYEEDARSVAADLRRLKAILEEEG